MRLIEKCGLGAALLVLFGLQLAAIIWYPERINHDVSIYVEIGHKILDGQLPYVDYVEINLLSMHYLAAVPVFIARVTDIASGTVMQLFVWGLSVISAGMCYLLGRRYLTRDSLTHYAMPLALALGGYLLLAHPDKFPVRLDFAQREHLFMLLFLPAIVSRALDWESRSIHPLVGFALGVLAGIGATIKPHFLLVPVLTEAGFMIQHRTIRPRISATAVGFITFGVTLAGYFLLVPGVLPALLDELRLVSQGYRGYQYEPLISFVMDLRMQLAAVLSISLWFWTLMQDQPGLRLARVMGLVTIAGMIIATVQEKGWSYHFIPFELGAITLIILLTFMIIRLARADNPTIQRWFILLIVGGAIMLSLRTVYYEYRLAPPELPAAFSMMERILDPGEKVVLLGEDVPTMYPWVNMIDQRQAASYLIAYPLLMAYYEQGITPLTTPQDFPPSVQRFVDRTRADLAAGHPVVGFSGLVHDFLIAHGLYDELIAPDYAMFYGQADYQMYVRVHDILHSDGGFQFGEHINLNGWQISAGETVAACDTMTVETVWSTDEPLNTAYSLTVVLAAEQGGVAHSDGTPSTLETTDWTRNRRYYDQRTLTVPCDLDAGNYSLLFSLYVPEEDGSNLDVYDPTGNGLGEYLFVRSITVSE